MEFHKLLSNTRILLKEIIDAEEPADFLSSRLEKASAKEKQGLKAMLRELKEKGYISIEWADNKPYNVIIHNSAITYEEQLSEYNRQKQSPGTQTITIGNKNSISNSTIAGVVMTENNVRKGFYEKHPVLCGFIISLVAGVILLFPFWQKIISFIEGLF